MKIYLHYPHVDADKAQLPTEVWWPDHHGWFFRRDDIIVLDGGIAPHRILDIVYDHRRTENNAPDVWLVLLQETGAEARRHVLPFLPGEDE